MTSAKMVLLAFAITGVAVVIGGSTAAYVVYRKAEEKLGASPGSLGRTISTFADFEETLKTIAGDEESDFGKRARRIREEVPFTRPPNGAMTEAQVQKFIAVKNALLAIDLEMKSDIDRSRDESDAALLLKWNFFTRLKRLRLAQIEELERQNMPVEEFRWVHVEVYKALVAEDAMPKPGDDLGASVGETVDRSLRAIDDELASSETSDARREELRELRARVEGSRDLLTGTASAIQESIASVPPENRQLVERYKEDLARVFMAAIDLDTVDFMKAMETAQAE